MRARGDGGASIGERLARRAIANLAPYSEEAGAGGLNLMNNANLFGANPAIAKALAKARPDHFWDYPSLTSAGLRRAIADHLAVPGLTEDMVVVGNGSNELIDGVMRAFCDVGDRVAYHPPTFSMIPVFMRMNGAQPVAVPLSSAESGFSLDAGLLVDARAKVTFVVRPNNPTGNAFPRRDVAQVVEEADGLVVVDEAYVEFTEGTSFAHEVPSRPNLVVLRTLSKAFGLAGFRVGYAIAHPSVARELAKARGPFKLNAMSEHVATLALAEREYVAGVAAAVKSERPRLARLLQEEGFRVHPSETNFLLVRPPLADGGAEALAASLARRGVYVRDFGGELAPYLRVTVGPPAVTARFLTALREAMPEALAKFGGARPGA